MAIHHINASHLSIDKIASIIYSEQKLALSEESKAAIQKARHYLDNNEAVKSEALYGINTGFGSLYNIQISSEKLSELQRNLVLSHACGTGNEIDEVIVKLMLLLKIQSLSYGHSGISLEVVERLIYFYNHDILPVVFSQGSLGASGDLAPLAHLSLPLLGEGEVRVNGEIKTSTEVLKSHGLKALELQSKEGLALLNGTQFMSAHAVYALIQAEKLIDLGDVISAVSQEGFDCNLSPFDALVHQVRPHKGQVETARRILKLREKSPLANAPKKHVQDPYSFRCIPQVHGASKDTFDFVKKTVEVEINSVTDNPNIFVDENKIISGGNFHGQPIALPMDYLAMALAEIANISERRTYQLVSGLRELPAFLVEKPGLNSGFMIPQYTAASIVSQNKQYCTPASIDSIVSSNGQEDHVSMGANSATKLLKVVENVYTVLGIELFNASQALYFRKEKSSDAIEKLILDFRKEVPIVKDDKLMATEIKKSVYFCKQTDLKKRNLI
ncbi:histidine ammonia-lyase [Psychroflexus halocasei]|uniref:Histidine ammonia-lyase n=1 Tax=Psychroflexus halocasei TaxID=908615 RepID=A0A1H4DM41_9FLAO|nr:histidine ammonia-lyase [Psychroflexus halocasei]SEA73569.1 histidine ammonia-lyase [Psychroflexus halocasei]